MTELIVDLLLPKTDRGNYIQWAVAVSFWIVVVFLTRNRSKEARQFVWGLFIFNLAWFAFRAIH